MNSKYPHSSEYANWMRLCVFYRDLCTGALRMDFTPMLYPTTSEQTEQGFGFGVGILIASVHAGITVPLIIRASPAGSELVEMANSALNGFMNGYGKQVKAGSASSLHGNSLDSEADNYLYQLEGSGVYLKTGVSQNPFTRYSPSEMQDMGADFIRILTGPASRIEMINLERFIVERNPGPLNIESWGGAFADDVPLAPGEGGDDGAADG
jgi:hypothetical protein